MIAAEERKLYVQYWQRKLHSNKSISFPDQLVDEVVKATDKFSFAYLKEALYVLFSRLGEHPLIVICSIASPRWSSSPGTRTATTSLRSEMR